MPAIRYLPARSMSARAPHRRASSVRPSGRGGGGGGIQVAGPRRALPVLGGDLAPRIGVGAANGLDVGTEDRPAVAARPLVRGAGRVGRALEARHHVAGEELVALEGLLAVGPLVGAEEQAAEAAGAQLPQLP